MAEEPQGGQEPSQGQEPKYEPKEGEATETPATTTFDAEYVKSLRAEAAKNRKEAQEAKAKVTEYEDANASEVEKLTKRAERAEQQMKDAQAVLLRFEVATEKKVPAELTPLLTGSTKEELESQATLLLDATAKKLDFDGGVREPASPARTEAQAFNDVALQALGLAPEQQK